DGEEKLSKITKVNQVIRKARGARTLCRSKGEELYESPQNAQSIDHLLRSVGLVCAVSKRRSFLGSGAFCRRAGVHHECRRQQRRRGWCADRCELRAGRAGPETGRRWAGCNDMPPFINR